MTPEQEDAHWVLQGKPLMRAWRERCRWAALAEEAAANGQIELSALNYMMARGTMQDAANAYYGVGTIVRYVMGAMAITGCFVKGVEYTMEDL